MEDSTREQHIYMAKITEQAKRFEDMYDSMNKAVILNPELTVQERVLLTTAYKNTIGSRRDAYRALSSKEQKKKQKNVSLLRSYKDKIGDELKRYCLEALNLIDSFLLDKAADAEAKVFYHKMRGDYYRYIAESSNGSLREKAEENAHSAYIIAIDMAKAFKTTHPIRLGLVLNYAVLYYHIKVDRIKGFQLAKEAFDDAIADIDQIEEDQYKESTVIVQQIRDNLTLWTDQIEAEDDI